MNVKKCFYSHVSCRPNGVTANQQIFRSSLIFIVNIFVAMTIFISLYCSLIVMKLKSVLSANTVCYVCMFFSSNELVIFVSIECFLVKMISYCLNLNPAQNLCAAVLLQSIKTVVVNSFCIKVLLRCFLVDLLVHVFVF